MTPNIPVSMENCPVHLSPDCTALKHAACNGDAWCDALDDYADCECPCHETVGSL